MRSHPSLNLAQTGSSLDHLLHLLQRRKPVTIRRLREVANLRDINRGRAPIVLCDRVSTRNFRPQQIAPLQLPHLTNEKRK